MSVMERKSTGVIQLTGWHMLEHDAQSWNELAAALESE
jgi:hypothetical protein